MITLYWYPKTRASRTHWLLRELGQPFELKHIDLRDRVSRADPGFRAASPMGKVPAISDGTVHMAEGAAIAVYLADRYPDAGLSPALDHPDRGRFLYWCTYTPAAIEPAMMERFNSWEVNPGTTGWGNFDRMIRTLERSLGDGPWILGERFSAADTLLGSSVYFMKTFGILPESPVLEAYLQRCLDRPAYAETLAEEAEAAQTMEEN
ncbi:MAG: glutathione S-transferase family protein [Pseudomonadota bacterium]